MAMKFTWKEKERILENQVIVIISNNERAGYAQLWISNLKTIFSSLVSGNDKKLFIAYRDFKNAKLPEDFTSKYTGSSTLPIGDIVIFVKKESSSSSEWLFHSTWERKAGNDIAGTDVNHFKRQYQQMDALPDNVIKGLIITSPPNLAYVDQTQLKRVITNQLGIIFNPKGKFYVINTFTEDMCAYAIEGIVGNILAEPLPPNVGNPDLDLLSAHGKVKVDSPKKSLFVTVNAIHGVGQKTATAVSEHFSSVREFTVAITKYPLILFDLGMASKAKSKSIHDIIVGGGSK